MSTPSAELPLVVALQLVVCSAGFGVVVAVLYLVGQAMVSS